jgi:CRP-like cAMP-binding protein
VDGHPFDVLAAGARHQLDSDVPVRRWPDGAIVFHQGDHGNALYVIVEGMAAVEALSAEGDTVMLALLGTGDCFGELAFFGDSATRSATVRAVGDLRAVVLSPGEVERLRRERRDVDHYLLGVLAAQVRRLSRLVVEAHHSTAEARIVNRLADAAVLFARPGRPLVVRLTQAQLASMAGATRPTTNRVLRRLEADGIVRRGQGAIEICDLERLAHQPAGPV